MVTIIISCLDEIYYIDFISPTHQGEGNDTMLRKNTIHERSHFILVANVFASFPLLHMQERIWSAVNEVSVGQCRSIFRFAD